MKILSWILLVVCCASLQAQPVSKPVLPPQQFHDQLRALRAETDDGVKFQRSKKLLASRYYSSLQIKDLAATFADESARLRFAMAAYPHAVDPENYYEVYDAFTSYSKVFRLHDYVRQARRPVPGPVVVVPREVSESEMAEIKKAIANATFNHEQKAVARQIIQSKKNFRAAQIREILSLFTFEQDRLELAKFAFDYTVDQDNYFVLNDVFTFSNTKEALANYIESKNP